MVRSLTSDDPATRCGDATRHLSGIRRLGQDRLDELLSRWLASGVGTFDSFQQLGRADRREGHVIVVADDRFKARTMPFGVDQHPCVKQQSAHSGHSAGSSGSTEPRNSS
jgi:hypothetical protein